MRRPEVSVVIPTRNRLGLLAQTLHTVLAQRDVDLEVIVVDEGSTDETPTWLADHPDPRLRTIRHDTPKGLSEARNAGIAAATGHWLGFTDDDDLWLPDKLTRQLTAARADGTDWSFGGALLFTGEPRLLGILAPDAGRARRLAWSNSVPGGGSNAIASRELIRVVGGFDPGVNIVADWDMWIRLLHAGPPTVLPEPLMAYRIHGSNMSRNVDEMIAAMQEIERRYGHLRGGEPLPWPHVHRWLWGRALDAGDYRGARQIAWRALVAGCPGATRLLARSCVPIPGRVAVNVPPTERTILDRVRPRHVVPWPDGTESWLRATLAVTP